MKVTFETNVVLPKLMDVASVINSKNVISILEDVCITVGKENLIFTASDGENWVTERADVLFSDMEATFCTPARDLINCIKSLSDENVTITLDEDERMMTLDYVSGKISLPYEHADDFPNPNLSIEGSSELIVKGSVLRSVIRLASKATENSIVRPIMGGVHFSFDNGKMTVNGACHLRVVKIVEDVCLKDGSEYNSFTLPPKGYLVISNVLEGVDENVKVRFTDKAVSVSNRNFKITARLLEGRYPDCDQIIPKENSVMLEVEKDAIVQALKHVLSIESDNSLVILTVSCDAINISAEDINRGRTSEETVRCKNENDGNLRICFNGNVLSDTVRSIDSDNVVLEMSAPTRPAIICSNSKDDRDRYMSVLMPMIMQAQIAK